MDVFGPQWERHWEKVEENWRSRVSEEDAVLLPGDHSWGMRLEEARPDLEFLDSLPGRKVLIRGNHDYWWQNIGRLRRRFPGLTFVQNDAVALNGVGVCGTKGYLLPGPEGFADPHDEKLYERERERLRLSLAALPADAERRIAMLHYPPLLPRQRDTGFTELLEQAGIDLCIYGHLHRLKGIRPFQGEHRGVRYVLVSCDFVGFSPVRLM